MLEIRTETPAAYAAASLRIIATAIVLACIYYASSVLITLICALFIAFILDPGVAFLERLRVPRWLGALVMVMLALTLLYLVAYMVYDRALAFIRDLPALVTPMQRVAARLESTIRDFWERTATALPGSRGGGVPMVRLQQGSP